MIRRKKTEVSDTGSYRFLVTDLVNIMGDSLLMAVEFGNEPTLRELTKLPSSLFLLVSEFPSHQYREISALLGSDFRGVPFIVKKDELPLVIKRYPLELIHIRSDYSLSYGEDIVFSLEIARDDVRAQLLTELTAVILQLRAVLLTSDGDSNSIGIRILRRMIPICKGLLSLRDLSIPVSWGSLVSELESSYNFTRFPLSEMIAALESDPSAELDIYFVPLLEIIEELRSLLLNGDAA